MQGVTYNTFVLEKHKIMAAVPQLAEEFDVIVIGTGLEESIVAAAAARNGHTVLHLDTNGYYGGDWAAFTFDGFTKWSQNQVIPEPSEKEAENLIQLTDDTNIKDIKTQWHIEEEEVPEAKENESVAASDATVIASDARRWTRSKVIKNSRSFNLDLTPRLLFARGSMVELLISSNISRYAEFKSVSRVLTMKGGKLEHVPSSRADVFATKHVSVVEKRILMKFITFCVEFDSHSEVYKNFEDRTFLDFLKHERLTENLINFVMHSIAMVSKDTGCLEGLKATQKFLTSIGRFGTTPFLWSMYGSGELPQAFCRLCAVFGGTYFLGKQVDGITVDNDALQGIVFNGQNISCKHLVADSRKFPAKWKNVDKHFDVCRKVCLLEDSVLPTEKEQCTFVSLPPSVDNPSYTFVKEVGVGTAACPKGMYVLHMTTKDNQSSIDVARVLTDDTRLIWSTDFKIQVEKATSKLSNVHFCSGPDFELDYDKSISNARDVFKAMFPDEEFLPRAPDPEEIDITGGADITEESGVKKEEEGDTKEEDAEKELASDASEKCDDKMLETKTDVEEESVTS